MSLLLKISKLHTDMGWISGVPGPVLNVIAEHILLIYSKSLRRGSFPHLQLWDCCNTCEFNGSNRLARSDQKATGVDQHVGYLD